MLVESKNALFAIFQLKALNITNFIIFLAFYVLSLFSLFIITYSNDLFSITCIFGLNARSQQT